MPAIAVLGPPAAVAAEKLNRRAGGGIAAAAVDKDVRPAEHGATARAGLAVAKSSIAASDCVRNDARLHGRYPLARRNFSIRQIGATEVWAVVNRVKP